MNKSNLALRCLRFSTPLVLLTLILLSLSVVAYGDEWKDQRCTELQTGLEGLEKRAPKIREEIAEKEEELASLQSFQKVSETTQASAIINHVPLIPIALVVRFPGIAPLLSDMLVRRGGDLLSDINKREIRLKMTELPRLREEQSEVGRQIFILRDERESLSCGESPTEGGAARRVVGEWQVVETGDFLRIKEEGSGMLLETMQNDFGFEEGDIVLSNFQVKSDLIEAELVLRAAKADCPTLRPITTKATINVQPGGKTFTLTAPSYAYCTQPCQWSKEQAGTLTRTFKRVAD